MTDVYRIEGPSHDADVALAECPTIEHCIIVKRGDFLLRVKEGRDHWYHRLMEDPSADCPPEQMEALTAASVATAIVGSGAEDVLVCGGGVHNAHLLERLRARLGETVDDAGLERSSGPPFEDALAHFLGAERGRGLEQCF